MSKADKIKLIRQKYPNISQDDLDAIVQDLDTPEKIERFRRTGASRVLASTPLAATGAAAKAGATAVGKLAKTFVPKTTKGKVVAGGLGALGLGIFESARGSQAESARVAAEQEITTEQALQNESNAALQLQFAQMQAQGVDVDALLNTPMGQQLIKNPTFNGQAIFGANWKLPTSGVGVFVGKGKGGMISPSAPPQSAGGKPVPGVYSDVISMQEWKEQFPISKPDELAKWKKTLVDAGVVSADAGLGELQRQWEVWGQFSQDSKRLGRDLSPFDLLEIQRGLWGGGGAGGPSYSTQLMKKANSRELLKQFMEQDTGRIISDEEADEFADLIRKRQLAKPTKTETKMVKGKRVTVTTPGFGEVEAAKLAEKRAMQDPLYAEFQTANVFGTALEKALGVRG